MKRLSFVILGVVWALHLAAIAHYVVDVPLADEWSLFESKALAEPLDWRWLIAPHNEHRIAVTRVYSWLLYRVDHLSFATQQVVNWFLFTAAMLALLVYIAHVADGLARWVIAAFALFLLSPLNWENHFWAFQSQFHFCVFFFFVTLRLLFGARPWAAVPFAWLTLLSFSSGVPMIAGALVVYCVYKRRAAWPVAVPIAFGVAVWFLGHRSLQTHETPSIAQAFDFFFGLVALGFGFTRQWFLQNAFAAVFVFAPFVILARRWRSWETRDWALVAGLAGMIGCWLAVTAGRAHAGYGWSKSSRYFELAAPAVLFGVAAWYRALAAFPVWRMRTLVAAYVVVFGAMADDWTIAQYQQLAEVRVRGLACLREKTFCPDICPFPVERELEVARQLDVPFTRGLATDGRRW